MSLFGDKSAAADVLNEGKEGYFASTSTTIEAVKNNIRNLLNTHHGERLMQPNLGIGLRKYLFSQLTPDIVIQVQNEISDTISTWLPFVEVRDIEVVTADDDTTVEKNTMKVSVLFNIKQSPNTLDSVQVSITESSEQIDNANQGGY